MNWITKEQAEKAGKGTQLEAAKCSLKRWEQAVKCSYEELRDGMLSGEAVFSGRDCAEYCALCWHNEQCSSCWHNNKCITDRNDGCHTKYQESSDAFHNFKSDTSRQNCDIFQTKAKALCGVIQKFMDGLEPKDEAIGHGDLVQAVDCNPIYLATETCPPSDEWHIWGLNKDGKTGYVNGVVSKSDRYYKRIGINIFDDLARNAEDLREYIITDGLAVHTTLQCSLIDRERYNRDEHGKDRCIQIEAKQDGRKCSFIGTVAEAKKFHQKLGQIIATALRDKRKEK